METTLNQPVEMKQRYAKLSDEIKELFQYGTVDVVLDEVTKEFGLDDNQAKLLNMEVELVLYLFLPQTGFAERIQESLELDKKRAEEIATRIGEDLFIIVKPELTLAEQLLSGEIEEENLATVAPTPQAASQTTPPETPEGLSQIHTFADDVAANRAHGYGANQQKTKEENNSEEPTYRSSQDDIIK